MPVSGDAVKPVGAASAGVITTSSTAQLSPAPELLTARKYRSYVPPLLRPVKVVVTVDAPVTSVQGLASLRSSVTQRAWCLVMEVSVGAFQVRVASPSSVVAASPVGRAGVPERGRLTV